MSQNNLPWDGSFETYVKEILRNMVYVKLMKFPNYGIIFICDIIFST